MKVRRWVTVSVAVLASGLVAPAVAAAQEVTPPSDLRVTGVTPFTVDLAWEPASVGGSTSLRHFALDESDRILEWFPEDASTGTVTGLEPDTTYTLTVGAWNGTLADSPRSNPVTFTTEDTEPLPVPTNLRVLENQSGTDLTVDYDVADDPRNNDFPEVSLNGQRTSNFGYDRANSRIFVHGLTPETDYTITISAVMDLGDGDKFVGEPSEPLSVTTSQDGQPPETPLGLGVRDRTGTSVSLEWGVNDPTYPPTDNVGVVDFLVSNGETTKVVPGDGSPFQHAVSYVFPELEPETTYSFTVRARDAAGNVSDPAGPLTVTTGVHPDITPPTPVTDLQASAGTYNFVSWDASTDDVTLTGAIRYRVTTDGGTDHTKLGTSYYDIPSGGLPPLKGCEVTVVAIDGAGNTSEPRSTPLC